MNFAMKLSEVMGIAQFLSSKMNCTQSEQQWFGVAILLDPVVTQCNNDVQSIDSNYNCLW